MNSGLSSLRTFASLCACFQSAEVTSLCSSMPLITTPYQFSISPFFLLTTKGIVPFLLRASRSIATSSRSIMFVEDSASSFATPSANKVVAPVAVKRRALKTSSESFCANHGASFFPANMMSFIRDISFALSVRATA